MAEPRVLTGDHAWDIASDDERQAYFDAVIHEIRRHDA